MNIVRYISSLLIFFFGLAISFISNFEQPEKNELLLIWDNKCYHLHHWITYGIIIISIYLNKILGTKYIHILTIFLLGVMAEDLFYRDILKIREPCSKSFTLSSSVYDRR